MIEQSANVEIHVVVHGNARASVLVFDVGEPVQILLRGLHGTVNGVEREIQAEPFILVPLDKLNRFAPECVGQIFVVLAASSFKVNAEMGLLTAIAIVISLVVDFLLLPALLLIGHQQERGKVHA